MNLYLLSILNYKLHTCNVRICIWDSMHCRENYEQPVIAKYEAIDHVEKRISLGVYTIICWMYGIQDIDIKSTMHPVGSHT